MGLEPIGTRLRYEMKDEFHSLRALCPTVIPSSLAISGGHCGRNLVLNSFSPPLATHKPMAKPR